MKTQIRTLVIPSAVAASALTLAVGCSTPAHQVTETQSITTVNGVDIQDFNQAADALSKQLITSGALDHAPRQPAILAISRFVNNTTRQIDMDVLLKTVRSNLLQTGKVQTTTTVGLGGNAEDPLARDIAAKNAFLGQPPAVNTTPDYALTGKIIQMQSHAGSLRQSVFVFQMSLTDVRSGTAVWEGDKQIIKQGNKANVGF